MPLDLELPTPAPAPPPPPLPDGAVMKPAADEAPKRSTARELGVALLMLSPAILALLILKLPTKALP